MSTIQAQNVNHPNHRENLKAEKYEIIKEAILVALPDHASGTSLSFDELEVAVRSHLAANKIPKELFPKAGSVRWYTKTVQLDLEAWGAIERLPNQSPLRFRKNINE